MKEILVKEIKKALVDLDYFDDKINININVPKNKSFGDLSSNIALILSKRVNLSAQEVANNIKNKMEKLALIKSISIAGPGFLNFYLNSNSIVHNISDIIKLNSNYGKNSSGEKKKAIVEFVSANPTGPLTVGHGRGAILGDTISNILEWNGYEVDREYYYNNAGRQMRVLGESVKARYLELLKKDFSFPEDGYQGQYIIDIAKELLSDQNDLKSDDKNTFKEFAEKSIFKNINRTLQKINIQFDNFFNENTLYENKAIYKVIDQLREKKLIEDKDNAVWFKGTLVGREQDRVLIKSTGEPTYRLPDMAYHIEKLKRGYDLCIDIFGADHMDAYPDVLEVVKQLGYDSNKIKVLIHQFISILKNGTQVKMSTRKATFITLDELIDEVGSDVVRYFFIMRGMNSHLNFDLEIAKEKSEKNPIYYIQYAHARIMSILRISDLNTNNANLKLLNQNSEVKIITKLTSFNEIVLKLKNQLEPQILANYLLELAAMFHKYYAKNKIINENLELSKARLVFIIAISIILKNGLKILGISAPEKM